MDAQFADAVTDRMHIARITESQTPNSGGDFRPRLGIPERLQPAENVFVSRTSITEIIVAYGLHLWQGNISSNLAEMEMAGGSKRWKSGSRSTG
jgi:hypothetical protein